MVQFKSIRHYSAWTYPAKTGYSVESNGENGYLNLSKIGHIQMRGKAKYWGKPTTCTIVHRHGKWYASITVSVLDQVLKPKLLPTGAIRALALGYKPASGQLRSIGKGAAALYHARYDKELLKREQFVDGTTRKINCYSHKDLSILDQAIKAVMERSQHSSE